jgi:hypothetical protein
MSTVFFTDDDVAVIARRWAVVRSFYHPLAIGLMTATAKCGPLDGGSFMVAYALETLVGGRICVLVDEQNAAQHAVLERNGFLWDYGGVNRPPKMMRRHNQRSGPRLMGYRPIAHVDLAGAAWDDELCADLTDTFRLAMKTVVKKNQLPPTPMPGDRKATAGEKLVRFLVSVDYETTEGKPATRHLEVKGVNQDHAIKIANDFVRAMPTCHRVDGAVAEAM